LSKRLPSLRALYVFEAAARRLSFTKAGDELNISQGAVSHQITILEKDLGVRVFHRLHSGVRLTSEGQILSAALTGVFGEISTAIEVVTRNKNDLRIKVQPAFTGRWLLPRLHRFQVAFPDIRLRITTSLDSVDFRHEEFDAAIATLSAPPLEQESVFLMKELLTPVCSPAFLRKHGPFKHPGDLLRRPIITVRLSDETKRRDTLGYWHRWLASVGAGGLEPKIGQDYDTLDEALRAAERDFGVTMADYALIQEELKLRRLTMPINTIVDQGVGYYLLMPRERVSEDKFSIFRDWLIQEMKKEPSLDETIVVKRSHHS